VAYLKNSLSQTKQAHERSISHLNQQLASKEEELSRLRTQASEMQARLDRDQQLKQPESAGDEKVAGILRSAFDELRCIDGSSFQGQRSQALRFLVFLCDCPQIEPLQCSLSVLGRAAMEDQDRDFLVSENVRHLSRLRTICSSS
jgi:hypothetical protein